MNTTENKNYDLEELPLFCDYSCKHAAFGEPGIVGDCRKELAVYCKLFEKYNNKNNKCLGKKKAANRA